MNRLFLYLFFFTGLIYANDLGFVIGNDLTVNRIRGSITVQCREGVHYETVYERCYDNYLTPAEYSKFQTKPGVDANIVVLTALHEDGSSRIKSSYFDPESGLSKSSFNLWILTLLQKPLLELGVNTVQYELKKGDQKVETGAFTAEVKDSEIRTCHHRFYTSHNLNDCRFPNRLCNRYFWEENDCIYE